MDKITRIHLAKIPYEIGVNAQIQLKKYLDEIRLELDADLADEIMTDIEVRITEILADRNVKRDDVITSKDIAAVQEQLGSPEQFNDDEVEGKQTASNARDTKRLLRDTDGAYIGGVASGLGAYFSVDPIFFRLIFVALTFLSGLGLALYILLWLLVPAAKTNSEKLQMRGEPVTAEALQRYRSTAQRTIANLRIKSLIMLIYKIFRVLFTIGVILFVLSLLSAIGFGSAVLYTQPLHPIYNAYHLNYALIGLVWLATMAIVGLLIILLLRMWRQRSSLKIAFVALTSVLVLALAGTAVITPFIVSHYKDQYQGKNLAVALPVQSDAAAAPTSLNLIADNNLIVSYVVTTQPIHASYQAYPGMGQPKIMITNKGGVISVHAGQQDQVVPNCVLDWCKHIYLPINVTLYGPALQKFAVSGGAELDLDSLVGTNLSLSAQNNSNLSISNSYSDSLVLSASTGATIDASDTSAQTSTIDVQNDSNIFGPASNTLKVSLPANCDQPLLELTQAPVTITLNNQAVTTDVFGQNPCVNLDDPTPLSGGGLRNRVSIPIPPTKNFHPVYRHIQINENTN